MYPAPSSPWSVHPDTNSHPKLEPGLPCSGGPAGAGPGPTSLSQHGRGRPSLPAPLLLPSLRSGPGSASRASTVPAVWGGWHSTPVLGECPRRVAQPPWRVAQLLQPPRALPESHQLFVLLALVLVLSHVLGLDSQWVLLGCAQGSVPFLSSVPVQLAWSQPRRGILPVPSEGGLGEQPHPGLGAQELPHCSRECILK